MSKPYLKWHPDERRRIISEYQQGATVHELARKHRHAAKGICALLKSEGLTRRPYTTKRHSTPGMRDFCRVLLSSTGTGLNVAELLDSMHERSAAR